MAIDRKQVVVMIDDKIVLLLHSICIIPRDPKECRCGAPAKVKANECGECTLAFVEDRQTLGVG